jgi:transmembrane sensor
MQQRETASTIDDAASEWAARIDRGLDDTGRFALQTWLAGDSRRVGALARAQALWAYAGESSAIPAPAPVERRKPAMTRRAMIGGGMGLAASVAALAVLPGLGRRAQTLETGIGEVRRIALEDGSAMTLAPQTIVRQNFDGSRRLIELLSGDAYFEVVPDAARPFLVLARWLTVRALETAFSVEALDGRALSVLVVRGFVDVTSSTGASASTRGRRLEANMQMVSSSAGSLSALPVPPDALRRSQAWRDGMLAFEDESLADVAAQFQRFSAVRIEIADEALARAPVTGVFAANDPKGFAHAIAASLDARVEDDGDVVRLRENRAQE